VVAGKHSQYTNEEMGQHKMKLLNIIFEDTNAVDIEPSRTDDVRCNQRVWEKLWAAVPLGSRQAVSEPTCLSVKLECCQKSSNYCFGGTVYVVLLVCNLETCILQEGCRTYVPKFHVGRELQDSILYIYILCG
jgi:hypothetical protein